VHLLHMLHTRTRARPAHAPRSHKRSACVCCIPCVHLFVSGAYKQLRCARHVQVAMVATPTGRVTLLRGACLEPPPSAEPVWPFHVWAYQKTCIIRRVGLTATQVSGGHVHGP
jgi:hypothetical protein